MKKTDRWMPLYLGDYTSGTLRLSTEAHGAYTLLIIDYWISGPPPNNNEILANITKMTLKRWKQMRTHLLPLFSVEDGKWRHKRIDAELRKAVDISNKRQDSGRLGAEARRQTGNQTGKQNDTPTPLPLLKEVSKTLMSELEKANIQHFEAFWKLYPSRGKHSNPKHPAMRKYLEAIKTTSFEEINKGAENYALSVKGEEQRFVAQAATWLNQKRWGDYQVGPKPRAHQGVYD